MSENAPVRKTDPLRIRPATMGDCKLLWEWANDPRVRESAFHSDTIPWEDHVSWFHAKLKDRSCRIFIALNHSDQPIGQIRFERIGTSDADIDISIGNRFRGYGYASQLIELASQQIFAEWQVRSLHAYVKPENASSRRVFETSGFGCSETLLVKGQNAVHYTRSTE